MAIRTLDDLDAEGARLGVRVDVNSPLAEDGLADDARIRAHLETLSEHDVIIAHAALPESEEAEAPVAVATGESANDDRFSTQSVCEACGALAGNLSNVNGQLLCADCREM